MVLTHFRHLRVKLRREKWCTRRKICVYNVDEIGPLNLQLLSWDNLKCKWKFFFPKQLFIHYCLLRAEIKFNYCFWLILKAESREFDKQWPASSQQSYESHWNFKSVFRLHWCYISRPKNSGYRFFYSMILQLNKTF